MKHKHADTEESRKLLNLWRRGPDFGDPIGCVATTYTFDAPFFEEECLARFAGIESDPREGQFEYVVEREERLAQVFACVLVDRAHVAKQRSLRWHLLPIRVPGGGIQHAKVSLLVWEHHIRLLISSANLTEPGYRRNWERMASLDFTPTGDLPLELLESVLVFLDRLQGLAPGTIDGAGPRPALAAFLGRTRALIRPWNSAGWSRGEPRAAFLPVFPGGPSLFEQIAGSAWSGTGPSEAWVLSPFYDQGDRSCEVVDRLVEIMAVQGERVIRLQAPGYRQQDGRVEIELPACLAKPWKPRRQHEFRLVLERDEDGARRDLHAKGLWLERQGKAVQVIGSSNFTSAGTGIDSSTANIEANLAYILPRSNSAFARYCRNAAPPSEELDPSTETVHFVADAGSQTPEAESCVPLPSGFGLALFVPEGISGLLRVWVDDRAPKGFVVTSDEGAKLLSSGESQKAPSGQPTEVPWKLRRPPSHLLVQWTTADGVDRTAIWVVNVSDASKLPAPEELRTLDLEDLLEILTSARPLHEVVGMVLRRRHRDASKPEQGPHVDPHKRVDARNFLIRRVRRVSAALEGMRQRLERPISGLDALRWRLHGPVGPLALAERLAESEGQGASFMIAEVALTTRQVDWTRTEVALGADVVRAEVQQTVSQLEALAAGRPSPANLSAYVRECFEAAQS